MALCGKAKNKDFLKGCHLIYLIVSNQVVFLLEWADVLLNKKIPYLLMA